MPPLGVTVTQRTTPPSRGTFSQTGTAFIAGKADLGSITVAKRLLSIGDFILNYGARVAANSVFYDAVDTAFQEGASVVWAAREVGPSKASDTINIPGTSGTGLVWTATDPGVSGVKLQVTNGDSGSNRILKVVDAATGLTVIAQTAQYTANSAAVGTLGPGVVTIGGGTGLTPVMAATAPTGGTSDAANVTSTQVQAATDLFLKAYGPGQILCPGQGTITGVYDVQQAHAAANNRFALWDNTDTATTATIIADLARLTATDQTYGAFCGVWAQIPGVNNSVVTRNVPASAVYAGLLARIDAAGNPNRAAVGSKFAPQYVVSLNTEFSDATVQTLYDAGVNTLQTYYGVKVSRGFRTPVATSVDPVNNQANCARLRMALIALLGPVGFQYYGEPLDGDGALEAAYAKDLEGELQTLAGAKAIYSKDSSDPYDVNVSAAVNTPVTIGQGQMIAVITYTPTTAAISVQIQLVAVPVSA
jgi:hypothetical protein